MTKIAATKLCLSWALKTTIAGIVGTHDGWDRCDSLRKLNAQH
jgi:hypothetical protein